MNLKEDQAAGKHKRYIQWLNQLDEFAVKNDMGRDDILSILENLGSLIDLFKWVECQEFMELAKLELYETVREGNIK